MVYVVNILVRSAWQPQLSRPEQQVGCSLLSALPAAGVGGAVLVAWMDRGRMEEAEDGGGNALEILRDRRNNSKWARRRFPFLLESSKLTTVMTRQAGLQHSTSVHAVLRPCT